MLDANVAQEASEQDEPSTLLIVDDDARFRDRLTKAMERRGYATRSAASVAEALVEVADNPPDFAIIDLRLDDGNGLDVVEALQQTRPEARAIVLSGYANISTAVAAVKLGAIDYLSIPVQKGATRRSKTGPLLECKCRALARVLPT